MLTVVVAKNSLSNSGWFPKTQNLRSQVRPLPFPTISAATFYSIALTLVTTTSRLRLKMDQRVLTGLRQHCKRNRTRGVVSWLTLVPVFPDSKRIHRAQRGKSQASNEPI